LLHPPAEVEFLDAVETKFIGFFLLAIHSLVCNVNIVYGNLKSEKFQDYDKKETSTKLYVYDFGFRAD
jgi:hypothetical protein